MVRTESVGDGQAIESQTNVSQTEGSQVFRESCLEHAHLFADRANLREQLGAPLVKPSEFRVGLTPTADRLDSTGLPYHATNRFWSMSALGSIALLCIRRVVASYDHPSVQHIENPPNQVLGMRSIGTFRRLL